MSLEKKLRVGVLGATGMVGQRFVTLLADHPWYEITVLAAIRLFRRCLLLAAVCALLLALSSFSILGCRIIRLTV